VRASLTVAGVNAMTQRLADENRTQAAAVDAAIRSRLQAERRYTAATPATPT
jgi:hypothetical protein